MNKEQLRRKAIVIRNQIFEEDYRKKSKLIISRLEELEEFIQAHNVLAYYSHGKEVITTDSLNRWSEEKELYLPTLNEDSSFIALPYGDLVKNRYGIHEPTQGDEPDKLDLIIVPGVAFDRNGGRLGMGKGYYDRFLVDKKGVMKIALAFHEQIVASIPKKPYDINVDIIITDKEIIR